MSEHGRRTKLIFISLVSQLILVCTEDSAGSLYLDRISRSVTHLTRSLGKLILTNSRRISLHSRSRSQISFRTLTFHKRDARSKVIYVPFSFSSHV